MNGAMAGATAFVGAAVGVSDVVVVLVLVLLLDVSLEVELVASSSAVLLVELTTLRIRIDGDCRNDEIDDDASVALRLISRTKSSRERVRMIDGRFICFIVDFDSNGLLVKGCLNYCVLWQVASSLIFLGVRLRRENERKSLTYSRYHRE